MRPYLIHAAAILGVFAMGSLIGATFLPGPWYAALDKPWFTPPGWVFGPIWSVLYVLIGWAGARKILHGGARGLWLGQMALNWLWSPTFFGMQWPLGGLVVILAMLVLILAFIVWEWSRDRLSAVLFLPYAVWVTLASAVNAGVVLLN
ncbi:MAG: TspO/MBR family protein [Gemmobacter sp.]